MSADEIESEASNDSHVLCAVPLSVSGEIVLELDIEDPVHASTPQCPRMAAAMRSMSSGAEEI